MGALRGPPRVVWYPLTRAPSFVDTSSPYTSGGQVIGSAHQGWGRQRHLTPTTCPAVRRAEVRATACDDAKSSAIPCRIALAFSRGCCPLFSNGLRAGVFVARRPHSPEVVGISSARLTESLRTSLASPGGAVVSPGSCRIASGPGGTRYYGRPDRRERRRCVARCLAGEAGRL